MSDKSLNNDQVVLSLFSRAARLGLLLHSALENKGSEVHELASIYSRTVEEDGRARYLTVSRLENVLTRQEDAYWLLAEVSDPEVILTNPWDHTAHRKVRGEYR